jgi:hypothetical protein
LLLAGPPIGTILGPNSNGDFAWRGYIVDRDIRFERLEARRRVERLPALVEKLAR